MVIKQLAYLVALAREKHFGRAAAACHISQPTLSGAIRALEDDLGVPLVERGHRFTGLTAEGEMILAHAKRILGELDTMGQSISDVRQGLSGRLRIGAIPTALPLVAQITGPFSERFPAVTLTIMSLTSKAIQDAVPGQASGRPLYCPVPDLDPDFDRAGDARGRCRHNLSR